MRATLFAVAMAMVASTACAQSPPNSVTFPAGAPLVLTTAKDLTSKKSVKGDQVELVVAEDVYVGGILAIPKGSVGVGTISMAQDTGAFGQSGKLLIEPLYVKIGAEILRVKGDFAKKGTITAPAAVGLAILTPGVTGRSAKIGAGTTIAATVLFEKTISLISNQATAR